MPQRSQWLTPANVVTVIRLLFVFPVVYCVLQEGPVWRWAALSLFLVAALSDGLDGYLARSRGEVTRLGQLLDPVADKVLGIGVFAALVYRELLPAWMLWTLVAKEAVQLAVGALLLTWGRQVSSARVLGKVATVALFSGFVFVMAGFRFGVWVVGAGVIMSVGAGIDYALCTFRSSAVRS